jgi:type IV pilus assembly protein PilZ
MVDNGDDGAERREHERHPIELKVEYKRLNKFFADYTRNICKGGTFIKTAKPLEVGTEFIFKLFVPELEEPLRIRGEVKWVVHPEEIDELEDDPREPGMGIRFIYADDAERQALEQMVEDLMVGSLGPLLYEKLMIHGRDRGEDGSEE